MGETYKTESWEIIVDLHVHEVEDRLASGVLRTVAIDEDLRDLLEDNRFVRLMKPGERISPTRAEFTAYVFEDLNEAKEEFLRLLSSEGSALRGVEDEIRIPVFGSPPETWLTLADLASQGARAVVAFGSKSPLVFIVVLAGGAVFMFFKSAYKGLLKGVEKDFERRVYPVLRRRVIAWLKRGKHRAHKRK